MKSNNLLILISALGAAFATSCHKDGTPGNTTTSPTSSQVLDDFVSHVAQPDYGALYSNAKSFQTVADSFCSNPNAADLVAMRIYWYGMRTAYESGEAFLIGPIATQNLDPHIDSWPVAQQQIDSVLNTNPTFNQSYIDGLPYTLKGFHVIEYLIFGRTTYSAFTAPQIAYLQAISTDLATTIASINNSYNVSVSGNYATALTTVPNSTYGSHKAALLDLINSMMGICDEVGGNTSDGKIYSVFNANGPGNPDTLLQESLFSRNSWVDFKNNITGVLNVYTATYGGNTPASNSLSNFVGSRNLSLNNAIITSMNNAIGSFNQVHQNFSQSVYTERTQCVVVMNAIDSLKSTLNNKLVPFINKYVTD